VDLRQIKSPLKIAVDTPVLIKELIVLSDSWGQFVIRNTFEVTESMSVYKAYIQIAGNFKASTCSLKTGFPALVFVFDLLLLDFLLSCSCLIYCF
jgi:hypothetical protein